MDPRAPLVLSTHDLGRRPGSMRRVLRVVPAPADLDVELIGVEEGSDLALDLRLEAVLEGVLVSGTVSAVAVGECGRCLARVEQAVTADVQELYLYERSGEPDGEDAEDLLLEGDLLDLEPSVRDAVVTALPFQPLCRPDCPGLCPECGARLADLPANHRHDILDPRWAALRAVGGVPAAGVPAGGVPAGGVPAGADGAAGRGPGDSGGGVS